MSGDNGEKLVLWLDEIGMNDGVFYEVNGKAYFIQVSVICSGKI